MLQFPSSGILLLFTLSLSELPSHPFFVCLKSYLFSSGDTSTWLLYLHMYFIGLTVTCWVLWFPLILVTPPHSWGDPYLSDLPSPTEGEDKAYITQRFLFKKVLDVWCGIACKAATCGANIPQVYLFEFWLSHCQFSCLLILWKSRGTWPEYLGPSIHMKVLEETPDSWLCIGQTLAIVAI